MRLLKCGAALNQRGKAAAPRKMLFLGGLLTLSLLAVVLYPPSLVQTLETVGYDEMIRFIGGTLPPPEVMIVDVDEASLAKLGQWPWPRYRVAALIEKASALGARSIAVDFLFPEPDRLSLDKVGELYHAERGLSLRLEDLPGDARDNDHVLAETVARHNVVLSADLTFGPSLESAGGTCGKPLNVVLHALPGTEGRPPVPQASGMVCPLPGLANAARFVAAANPLPDQDGKLRRVPLVLRSGEQWVPSIALAALLAASGDNQVVMHWSAAGVLELHAGKTIIPTDHQGNLLLPYRMRPTDRFHHLSAADLLEGRAAPNALQGKIVLIGSSASGLQDMHATPNMRACPGIDLHALTVDAMVRGDFFVEPGWNLGMQLLIVLLAGILVSTLMAWTPITLGAGVTGGMALALILGTWTLFQRWGIYCSPIPGLIMLLGGSALLVLVRLRWEEKRVLDQIRELSLSQNCALLGLVSIAETRDPETGQHIIRTQHFVKMLADHLRTHPRFRHHLTPENIETLFKSAPLHDIGKVGVPDNILLKRGRLTEEEFAIIKHHTSLGHKVLARAEEMAGLTQEMSFLKYAKEVARSHHEKWDGSGYPDGLKGEEIPVSARLMALADVYDALRAKRVYKEPMSHETAKSIILGEKGKHFDPAVADAFVALEQSFQAILERHADTVEMPEKG